MNEFQTGVIRPIELVKEAWEIIKPDYWILFGITLVGALIGGATMYVLMGAMMCGIIYCFLQRIDGNKVEFDFLWKGFQWWLPGFVALLFILVPIIVLYIVIYAPFIAAMILGPKLNQSEMIGLLLGSLAVDFVLVIVMVCFHTLIMFLFPLIVDRNLGVFAAMKLSARAVWQNLAGVAGLFGVMFVMNLVAMMTCVGLYFVLPLLMATTTLAYRKVFPRIETNGNPPPASFYQ